MARGWESKAVADQIEDEKTADNTSRPPPADHSPEARLKGERLHSLRLSKSRLLQQLERATHPAHRTVLENGLKAIEAEIEQLGES
jgi:hypothetical protein